MEVVEICFQCICCVVGLLMLTVATCENIRRFNLRMVNGGLIFSCRVSHYANIQAELVEWMT
jgi:hypothetical protein